jgi:GTP pyrophosphokinase
MLSANQFVKKVLDHNPKFNKERILKGFEFGKAAHDGQKRKTGEPYYIHPIAVTLKLLEFAPDEDMIIASLLHDVSEDTETTLDEIEAAFGVGVRNMVYGLEKVGRVRSRVNEPNVENLRKMFVTMASDLRVIIIKLCDRWHNMTTLDAVPDHKRQRIARETMDVYVPIASRLGIYGVKSELQDLCFKYIYPDMHEEIEDQLKSYSKSSSTLIKSVEASLNKYLQTKGYSFEISSRVKDKYSIYKKLKKKGSAVVDEIYDIFAIRIVTPTVVNKLGEEDVSDLYKILGDIHNRWTPLPNRFKDYIAVPKPNGYRSLHTTVIGLGPDGYNKPIEIQLRNEIMHDEAEKGVASHWAYKDAGGKPVVVQEGDKKGFLDGLKAKFIKDKSEEAKLPKKKVEVSRTAWVNALEELQRNTPDGDELIEDLQRDVFNDRIFVLTPNGDTKDLPKGATPVDFAYSVHTDVGHKCVMAKVNGSIVPLDYHLKNGEVVDIITKEDSKPNQYWLGFVVTSGAKSRIKSFFKSEDGEKNIKEGKEILNTFFEKMGKPLLDAEYSVLKKYGDKDLTLKQREKILEEVGAGVIVPSVVYKSVFANENRAKKTKKKVKPAVSNLREVVIDGGEDLRIRYATCCDPQPGTKIVGYVTRGSGISIHAKDCKVMLNGLSDRTIPVRWKGDVVDDRIDVSLCIELVDRVGFLFDVSQILRDEEVNIKDLSLDKNSGDNIKMRLLSISVNDEDQLKRIISKLERVESVIGVRVL